jgi:electron transfer flavoprotein alpha/beta subunit
VILEQVTRIDAGGEQCIALQVRALSVGCRRHAHASQPTGG